MEHLFKKQTKYLNGKLNVRANVKSFRLQECGSYYYKRSLSAYMPFLQADLRE